MKKEYTQPEIEIISFDIEDVIVTSGDDADYHSNGFRYSEDDF